ncbi:MAG: glycosyltransferase family 2 protein [Candidatus Wallbacteria bacterium]|nr:glycosyltransferase family 2 protein [Candidatus Wallbacteria bacterium]
MPEAAELSVVIITFNEERNIARCLDSVAFAGERVVVDSASTDRTVELARERSARVVQQEWLGFGPQKNHAIGQATRGWVLVLDADEWIPEPLAREIAQVLRAPSADVYEIRRETLFLGRPMTHCWSGDWTARLFRRGTARYDDRPVHERLLVDAGARGGRLAQPYMHDTYRDLSHYVEKMNRYSDLFAYGGGAASRVGLARLLGSPLWAFAKMYLLKRGFLDGVEGLILSAGTGYYHLLKYAKRWAHQKRSGPRAAEPEAGS